MAPETQMLCRDVMKAPVVSCKETDTVRWCARVMADHSVGFLPILDGKGGLAGVLTDRDIVVRALAEGKSQVTEARSVMTRPAIVCRPADSIEVVEEQIGTAKRRRLPVVDERGVCVGVISLADIAQIETVRRAGQVTRDISWRGTHKVEK